MSARAAKPTPGLALGAEPRANLLPPEVKERVKARRTRGYLVILVIAVLAATAGAYVFVSLRAITARAELEAAQIRTSSLLQEKATYSDVIATSSAIDLITATRQDATSTEVVWGDILKDRILAALPPGSYTIISMSASAPMPWESPLAPAGPLREPRVGTFEFSFVTPTQPDGTALYRAMEKVEGVADISIDTVQSSTDPIGYLTTVTINLDDASLSGRFVPDEEGDDDEGQ